MRTRRTLDGGTRAILQHPTTDTILSTPQHTKNNSSSSNSSSSNTTRYVIKKRVKGRLSELERVRARSDESGRVRASSSEFEQVAVCFHVYVGVLYV